MDSHKRYKLGADDHNLERCRVYEVPGILDAADCAKYISRSERATWRQSNINTRNPLYSRSLSDLELDVGFVLSAARQSIPVVIDDMRIHSIVKERTACIRYKEGEYFGLHTDAAFVAQDGSGEAKLSLVLYLNEDYLGGETVFPDLHRTITPKRGAILLFAPELRHMSNPVLRGTKYIVRSEIFYQRSTVQSASPGSSDLLET